MDVGTITSTPDEMREGLFGGAFLFILEALPGLAEEGVRPRWDLETKYYGRIIPSLLELVEPVIGQGPSRSIAAVRGSDRRALGGDFDSISRLWTSYFRPAEAVVEGADRIDPGLENSLGVHYRGGDKLNARWDTNPITREDYLRIIQDRLDSDPTIEHCLIASDDERFIELAKDRLGIPKLVLEAGEQHKSSSLEQDSITRARLALRDCLLLSRCRAIMQTSSALPSFAKVLRPEVDCRRCTASKWFSTVPYFPVAYIPIHEPGDPRLRAIIDRGVQGDWTREPEAAGFRHDFAFVPSETISRKPISKHWWFRLARRMRLG